MRTIIIAAIMSVVLTHGSALATDDAQDVCASKQAKLVAKFMACPLGQYWAKQIAAGREPEDASTVAFCNGNEQEQQALSRRCQQKYLTKWLKLAAKFEAIPDPDQRCFRNTDVASAFADFIEINQRQRAMCEAQVEMLLSFANREAAPALVSPEAVFDEFGLWPWELEVGD